MTTLERISLAARVFSLAAILSLAITFGTGSTALTGVLVLLCISGASLIASASGRVRRAWLVAAEACLVGATIGITFQATPILVPYLAIPALMGGLHRGITGLWTILAVELITFAGTSVRFQAPFDATEGQMVLTWVITGLGLGLLGSFVRSIHLRSAEADENYRNARELLTQLRALSGRLTAGLDPTDIADRIMSTALEELGAGRAAVFVRSDGDVVTPLRYSDAAAVEEFYDCEALVIETWKHREVIQRGFRTLIPLAVDHRVVATLVVNSGEVPADAAITRVVLVVGQDALRLDTALLFDDVRLAATHEERHRLAREVHDGVAQDVASLGYLLDDLAAEANDEAFRDRVHEVRSSVQQVVSELRYSVFDLRNDVSSSEGLGTSIARYARQVGSRAGLKVHLTLDEGSMRLRPDVEAELLRIAQEAMTNARRHSQARTLWVSCSVHPPMAEILVRDDGVGIQPASPDSQGVRIMRERAERISARLEISDAADTGTQVRVRIGPVTSDGLADVNRARRESARSTDDEVVA